MNELKPSECAACQPWGFSEASDKARKTHCSVCAGTGLVYAIPDTHRVVSVELLREFMRDMVLQQRRTRRTVSRMVQDAQQENRVSGSAVPARDREGIDCGNSHLINSPAQQ